MRQLVGLALAGLALVAVMLAGCGGADVASDDVPAAEAAPAIPVAIASATSSPPATPQPALEQQPTPPPTPSTATPPPGSMATATPEATPTASPTPALDDMDNLDDEESEYDIVTLLPRDAIPAILQPEFLQGEEAAATYEDVEQVLGLSINGDHRAYPLPFLSRHEIVNDVVGGQPVAVTW